MNAIYGFECLKPEVSVTRENTEDTRGPRALKIQMGFICCCVCSGAWRKRMNVEAEREC